MSHVVGGPEYSFGRKRCTFLASSVDDRTSDMVATSNRRSCRRKAALNRHIMDWTTHSILRWTFKQFVAAGGSDTLSTRTCCGLPMLAFAGAPLQRGASLLIRDLFVVLRPLPPLHHATPPDRKWPEVTSARPVDSRRGSEGPTSSWLQRMGSRYSSCAASIPEPEVPSLLLARCFRRIPLPRFCG